MGVGGNSDTNNFFFFFFLWLGTGVFKNLTFLEKKEKKSKNKKKKIGGINKIL